MTDSAYTSAQLRIHSLDTGDQLVLESTTQLFEAPNWTPDGQTLIVNCDGRIHTVSPAGGQLEPLDSGWLDDLNNDHVLSPDGRTLYVSANDGHIYALPVTGGTPRRITNDRGPDYSHYLHGVSPDGQTLAYVGLERRPDGSSTANVFTLPADGGPDLQLTSGPLAADGPEYSPDGQWIYFNREADASEPGHSQLFRMRPDGGELTQLTFDERVNWFPHLSPDGLRLVYLSFPPGTLGHPPAREVILRTVSPDGGEVTDVATFRGGQGTLNVNSWAPDSRRFAYVSYPA